MAAAAPPARTLSSSSIADSIDGSTRPTSVSSDETIDTKQSTQKKQQQPRKSGLEGFGFTRTIIRAEVEPLVSTTMSNTARTSRLRPTSWLADASDEESPSKSNDSIARGTVKLQEDLADKKAQTLRKQRLLEEDGPAQSRQLSGATLVDAEVQDAGKANEKGDDKDNSDNGNAEEDGAAQNIEGTTKPPRGVRKALNSLANASTSLGKRSREVLERGKEKLLNISKRKSSRLVEQDEKPEVEPPSKKQKLSSTTPVSPNKSSRSTKPKKSWLKHGLYVGQDREFDARKSGALNKLKRESIGTAVPQGNKLLPMPMFFGEGLLKVGRDFKLPYDIYNPLPQGQPKPDEWKKTQQNRIIGTASAVVREWSKSQKLPPSKCACVASTGCDDDCINRYMYYECNPNNCGLDADTCTNRQFSDLRSRCKSGRKYDIGIEVVQTEYKGFGVRSCRTFEPGQIIVEYAGEIIDQEECDRRIREDYNDSTCYYLMEYHNNMIIDGTRGSMARFVNHSCAPNCEMTKWLVDGKPRMALFAGDRGVMTGEELSYDYNYANFSSNKTTPCRCGAPTCRGFLGRKPSEQEAKKMARDRAIFEAEEARKREMEANADGGKKRKRHKGWVYLDSENNVVEPVVSSSEEEEDGKEEEEVKSKKRKTQQTSSGSGAGGKRTATTTARTSTSLKRAITIKSTTKSNTVKATGDEDAEVGRTRSVLRKKRLA